MLILRKNFRVPSYYFFEEITTPPKTGILLVSSRVLRKIPYFPRTIKEPAGRDSRVEYNLLLVETSKVFDSRFPYFR